MSRLRFSGVTRHFGRHRVLGGIDLDVAPGQRVLLLGHNGAGKTTLLRLAAGLLRPTSGTVMAGGRPPTQPAGRRGLGYLPQDAPVYAELTVHEHLQWWGRVHGRSVDAGWAQRAGLQRLAHQPCSNLSRGQRQRLGIAMALAVEPTLLLLDEPTTALDAAGRQWLEQELAKSPAAMVLASHDEAWCEILGARPLRLHGGVLKPPVADEVLP